MGHHRRLQIVSIDTIFGIIDKAMAEPEETRPARTTILGESIKINSLRMMTFYRKGIQCVCCKQTARFFAIERTQDHGSYHLNLYGECDGHELLFTHDHIIARSLPGGHDDLNNTVPMCTRCNNYKSTYERNLFKRFEVMYLEKLRAAGLPTPEPSCQPSARRIDPRPSPVKKSIGESP